MREDLMDISLILIPGCLQKLLIDLNSKEPYGGLFLQFQNKNCLFVIHLKKNFKLSIL
jgi:hypothetical protein